MESIPGCRVHFTLDEIVALVHAAGCCIVGQTDDLVPADMLLYAIRDTTATTESVPLIAGRIWSQFLDGLVAWHSGEAFHLINEVSLRRAGIVLGRVTTCEHLNHFGM